MGIFFYHALTMTCFWVEYALIERLGVFCYLESQITKCKSFVSGHTSCQSPKITSRIQHEFNVKLSYPELPTDWKKFTNSFNQWFNYFNFSLDQVGTKEKHTEFVVFSGFPVDVKEVEENMTYLIDNKEELCRMCMQPRNLIVEIFMWVGWQ